MYSTSFGSCVSRSDLGYERCVKMDKVKLWTTPEISFFQGYITAAAELLIRGQLEATLEACAFEITDRSIRPVDVIAAAYPGDINPIDYVTEESVEQLENDIHAFLTVHREFWKSDSVPSHIESRLRQGYWGYLSECFDYKHSQVFAVVGNVPYVNIGPGFTYVLYNNQVTRCFLLVGNLSD